METTERRGSTGAANVAVAYIPVSVVWILSSDWVFGMVLSGVQDLQTAQTAKGIPFVLFSGAFVYGLVPREQRRLAATNED